MDNYGEQKGNGVKILRDNKSGRKKVLISQVISKSIAEELEIEPGDRLVSVSGQVPADLLDYRYLCAEEELELEILKQSGEVWACEIEKEYDEDLGLVFEQDAFDGIRSCANNCIFCFVDQMPPDMRESLYVKDDDYRLSFLHGNFITLTNLTEKDMDRIIRLRLSPLYISVHSTEPEIRNMMLGHKKAGQVMDQMKRLAGAGISMHTQIVLCPGINDGSRLDKTIRDLGSLWPAVMSVAVVPVGLTCRRNNLFELRCFEPKEAEGVINQVGRHQAKFVDDYDLPLVYLADEFYILAGAEYPPAEHYGEYPQLENGVGLVRLFYESFSEEEKHLPQALPRKKTVVLATGLSGEQVLRPVVERLNQVGNLQAKTVAINNEHFGRQVTVAGLLTGRDVSRGVREHLPFDILLLPSSMCKSDEPVFLDGMTVRELQQELGIRVEVVDLSMGAGDLVRVITD